MFRRGEFYGYDLQKKLKEQRGEIRLSRLYRILNEMERERLLRSRWESSTAGPRKKMYQLSEEGRKELRKILLDSINTVHEFYGDYLFSLSPEINVFDEMFDWFTQGLTRGERIAFLVTSNSPLNEIVFRSLSQKMPHSRIQIIASKNVSRLLKIESRIPMKGEYDDFPFKDGFFNMIFFIGFPPFEIIEESFSELCRVLDENGRLGFITPSVLLQELEDPITIGDFIEKHEHEVIEQGEHLDKELVMKIMREKFLKIEEKELVHITMLKASQPLKPV